MQQEQTQPKPYGAIIKRADVEHWNNAAEAHEAAHNLYKSAQSQVQNAMQEEGERGYHEGFSQGMAASQTQIAAQLTHLNQEFKENAEQLSEVFPKLVMDCVTRIMGTMKLTVAMRKIVEETLHKLNAPIGFTLKIPSNMPTQNFIDLLDGHHKAGNPTIHLEVDETLEPTQTQLVSRSGIINLGIEDQLRTLRELLGLPPKNTENESANYEH